MTKHLHPSLSAIVLAGGKARRFGGIDKGLVDFKGKPLIQRTLEIISPLIPDVQINANRSLSQYADLGFEVVADDLEDFQGPLAGMATALALATTSHVLFLPCDCPLLEDAIVHRLAEASANHPNAICVAHDGNRLQPVFAVIPKKLEQSLRDYLLDGQRKIDRWYALHPHREISFADCAQIFININSEAELNTALEDLAQQESERID